eukprot:450880-Prymnesium_polylepis.1
MSRLTAPTGRPTATGSRATPASTSGPGCAAARTTRHWSPTAGRMSPMAPSTPPAAAPATSRERRST